MELMKKLQDKPNSEEHFSIANGLLFYKGKFFVGEVSSMKAKVLALIHDSPLGGHYGYLKTLQRTRQDWFWHGMQWDIKAYVRGCDTC